MNDNQDLQQRIAGAASRHFGTPRFQGYLDHCGGDQMTALAFYQWNTEVSAAMWETLGHLEEVLRNRVAGQLDDDLAAWVGRQSRLPAIIASAPQLRPHP